MFLERFFLSVRANWYNICGMLAGFNGLLHRQVDYLCITNSSCPWLPYAYCESLRTVMNSVIPYRINEKLRVTIHLSSSSLHSWLPHSSRDYEQLWIMFLRFRTFQCLKEEKKRYCFFVASGFARWYTSMGIPPCSPKKRNLPQLFDQIGWNGFQFPACK